MLNTLRTNVRLQYLLVFLSIIAFRALTTPSSAFFLHEDTANQHVTAIEIIRGCFVWTTEKWVPAFILAFGYAVVGIQDWLEPVILFLFAGATGVCVFYLTRKTTQSLLWATLAVVLLEALPAYQYFSRTYWGYTPLLLIAGWVLLMRNKWLLGGLLLGAAVISHFNAMVFVFFSTIFLAVFFLRPQNWKSWLKYALAGIFPLFCLELFMLAHLGPNPLLPWTIGVYNVLTRLATPDAVLIPNWDWLLEALIGTNGLVLTLFLTPMIAAPFAIKRDKALLAFTLSALSIAAFYTLQAGAGGGVMLTKVLVLQYPFWVVLAIIGLHWLVTKVEQVQQPAALGLFIILAVLMAQTGLFMRTFTQTVYPTANTWFAEASAARLPIKQVGGNIMPPQYFAQKHGVEVLVNQADWVETNTPEDAVLLFLNTYQPTGLAPEGYTQTIVELPELSERYPLLKAEASVTRRAELWWPTDRPKPTAPLSYRTPLDVMDVYYSGTGCLVPPSYGNGLLHYYQLVLQKIF